MAHAAEIDQAKFPILHKGLRVSLRQWFCPFRCFHSNKTMADDSVVIEGLRELNQFFDELPGKKSKQVISRCIDPTLQVVQEALREAAPVHIGILEESMVIGPKKWEDGAATTTMTVTVGPSKRAFWGKFLQEGTQEKEGTTKRGRHFRHAASEAVRWMTSAWESSKDRALSVFATEATAQLQDLENGN